MPSYSIWGAFAETPWWIYLIFTYFLFVSWQTTKPQRVNSRTAISLPISLIIILYLIMPLVISVNLHNFLFLLLFILPGMIFGLIQFHFRGIKAIKNTRELYIPGSWSVFIFLMMLVIIRFYYYNYAVDFSLTSLNENNHPAIIMMLIGFVTGLFIARTWCLYRCVKFGPYKD